MSHPLSVLLDEYDASTEYSLALVEGLDSDNLAWRPDENSSAIAWHLGHQGAVGHFMLRNLTAAEVTFNADFDAVFDSATPEPGRGALPPIDEIIGYRRSVSESIHRVINRIDSGDVGAPAQLRLIASGLMCAVVNHEYQHAKWVGEVRATMISTPAPEPDSDRLIDVDGYWMINATAQA